MTRMDEKLCPKCGEIRPVADWHKNKGRPDGLATWCKLCVGAYHRAWRAKPEVKERQARLAAERYAAMTLEEKAEYTRAGTNRRKASGYNLRQNYGLTIEEYQAQLERQGGGCAICEKVPDGSRKFPVDHDHSCCPGRKTCGKCLRGILCVTCNVWLGFYENKLWVNRAEKYLRRELSRIEAES